MSRAATKYLQSNAGSSSDYLGRKFCTRVGSFGSIVSRDEASTQSV
jgi:predicted nucleotidyltransferase